MAAGLLKADMKTFFCRFGEVIGLVIFNIHGEYMGQGYATLNLTPKGDQPMYHLPGANTCCVIN